MRGVNLAHYGACSNSTGVRPLAVTIMMLLGAVHILRQPPEGGGGVSQKLTIADKGG